MKNLYISPLSLIFFASAAQAQPDVGNKANSVPGSRVPISVNTLPVNASNSGATSLSEFDNAILDEDDDPEAEDMELEIVENVAPDSVIGKLVVKGGSGLYRVWVEPASELFRIDPRTLEIISKTFLDYESLMASGGNVFELEVTIFDMPFEEEMEVELEITVIDDGFQAFTVADMETEVVENQVAGTTVAGFPPLGGSGDHTVEVLSASSDLFAFDDQTLDFTATTFLDYEALVANGRNVAVFKVSFEDNITREKATAIMKIIVTDDGFQPFAVADVKAEVVENQVAGTTVSRFAPAGGSGYHTGKLLSASSDLFAFNGQTQEFIVSDFLDYEEMMAKGGNVAIFEVDFTDQITREEATATMQITVTDDGFQPFTVADEDTVVVENQVAGTMVARFVLPGGPENYTARVLSASSHHFAFRDQTLEFIVKDFLDYEEMMAEGSNVAIFEVNFMDNTTREEAMATMQITVTDDGFQAFTVADVDTVVVENQVAGTPIARFAPAGGSGNHTARILSASSHLFAFDNQTLAFTTSNFLDYEEMVSKGSNVAIFEVSFIDDSTKEKTTAVMQITVADDGFQPFAVADVEIEVVENQVAGTPVARLEQAGGSGSYATRILSASSGLFAFNDQTLEFTVSDFLDYEEMMSEGSNVVIFEVNFKDNITREEATPTVQITVTDDGFQPFTVADEDAVVVEKTNAGTVVAQFNPQGGSRDCVATLNYASTGHFSFDVEAFAFKLARPFDDQDFIDTGTNVATFEVDFKDNVTREEATAIMRMEIIGVVTGIEALNQAGYHFQVDKDKRIYFTGPEKAVHSFNASVYSFEGRRAGTLNFTKTGANTWESDGRIAQGLNIIVVTGLDKNMYTFKILSP